MARSIDSELSRAVRGFVPAQNDDERFLMRHIEDLARLAESRGIARYSAFLSDREQALAVAALNRAGCGDYRFDGGYPEAERKLLAIEPGGAWGESPLCCVRIDCRGPAPAKPLTHRDYLGSLMGLRVGREAMGDIVLPPEMPGTAFVFVLQNVAQLLCDELRTVGSVDVSCQLQPMEQLPPSVFAQSEREVRTATVSSLRLDAVLAAMLRCSRGMAAELIAAGRVEINHLPAASAHAPVYEGDVFTVRGKGRYRLTALPGKSKKERVIIAYFQYQ
jgi:RNA-binding protein YlmH